MTQATTRFFFLLLMAASGCGGETTQPACGNGVCESGESSATCCSDCACGGGLVCQSNACVAAPRCGDGVCNGSETKATCCSDCGCPGGESCSAATNTCAEVCTATGASCTTPGACCNYQQGIGTCVDFGSGGQCANSCKTNAGCPSGCCQTTQQGDQICAPASFCTNLALGAPCTTNAECNSGLCVNGGSGQGWCSETCTSSSACPNSPVVMWCAANSSGAHICWTACSTNADCTAYGPNAACTSATTVEGTTIKLCTG